MTVTEDVTWRAQAACRGMPPDLFFPEMPEWATNDEQEAFAQTLAQAYSICEGCPVRGECLAYGKSSGEAGVWGGQYLGKKAKAGGLDSFTTMRDGVSEPKRTTHWDTLKNAQNVRGVDGPPTLAEYVKSQATNGATTLAHQAWVRRRNSEPKLPPDWNDRPMLNGTALHAEQVYIEIGIATLEDRWVSATELERLTGLSHGATKHTLWQLRQQHAVKVRRHSTNNSITGYQAVL